MPVEPPPTAWRMPDPRQAGDGDLIGVGADLEPGTILAAYRAGLFPMPIDGQLGWWSPDPRGILPLDGLQVSRSLRRSCRRFEIRVDSAFDEVIDACAAPGRTGRWITREVVSAYRRLHQLGWAHSIEAWTPDGALAGGLYGVAIGGLFAGESMFHRCADASKVALVALVDLLVDGGAPLDGGALLDVQWQTDHLASLGVVEIPRSRYLALLAAALQRQTPPAFAS